MLDKDVLKIRIFYDTFLSVIFEPFPSLFFLFVDLSLFIDMLHLLQRHKTNLKQQKNLVWWK